MDHFLELTLITGILILSPGPAFSLVMQNSMTYGKRLGMFTVMGIVMGDSLHIILSILGLSYMLLKFPQFMMMLRFVGSFYLLYLGAMGLWTAFQSKDQAAKSIDFSKNLSPFSLCVKAMGVAFLNPQAILFFFNFFAVMVPVEWPLPFRAGYGAWVIALVLFWFSSVSFFFSSPHFQSFFDTHKTGFKVLTSLAFVYCGLKMLFFS